MARLPKLFLLKYEEKLGREKLQKILFDNKVEVHYDGKFDFAKVDNMMYVRDLNNRVIGIVIVNKGYCAWSLCHPNDKWDKLEGILKTIYKLGSKKTLKEIKKEVMNKLQSPVLYNDKCDNNSYGLKINCLFLILDKIDNYLKGKNSE